MKSKLLALQPPDAQTMPFGSSTVPLLNSPESFWLVPLFAPNRVQLNRAVAPEATLIFAR